jgi:hypothetical protein
MGRKINTAVSVLRRGWADEHGDVLMEYVILTTCIVLPLVGVVNGTFNPTGQPLFNPAGAVTGNFGLFGNEFVGWYQRLVCGIGLPIP